jgi:hypothetical protein
LAAAPAAADSPVPDAPKPAATDPIAALEGRVKLASTRGKAALTEGGGVDLQWSDGKDWKTALLLPPPPADAPCVAPAAADPALTWVRFDGTPPLLLALSPDDATLWTPDLTRGCFQTQPLAQRDTLCAIPDAPPADAQLTLSLLYDNDSDEDTLSVNGEPVSVRDLAAARVLSKPTKLLGDPATFSPSANPEAPAQAFLLTVAFDAAADADADAPPKPTRLGVTWHKGGADKPASEGLPLAQVCNLEGYAIRCGLTWSVFTQGGQTLGLLLRESVAGGADRVTMFADADAESSLWRWDEASAAWLSVAQVTTKDKSIAPSTSCDPNDNREVKRARCAALPSPAGALTITHDQDQSAKVCEDRTCPADQGCPEDACALISTHSVKATVTWGAQRDGATFTFATLTHQPPDVSERNPCDAFDDHGDDDDLGSDDLIE